ncbi:MAG: long-chain fatty acid--CoA ligase, partial [Corynebacterium sp.]|nr:long-chain fatty acid--CoA ligase [Corynebacterium sp.]
MSENTASTPDDQEAPKSPSTTWKDHPWWDAYPEWVNPELDYHAGHERTLAAVFDRAVRTWPDRPAM